MNIVTLTLALAFVMTIASFVGAYKLRKLNNALENKAKANVEP